MGSRTGWLAAGLVVMLPFAGCASVAPPRVAGTQAMESGQQDCAYATGSRIRPRQVNRCEPNRPLRSYSKEQLDATGEIDLNDALRELDPVFR